jgi:cytochrome c-type biogenesis protein CcmE
MKIKLIIGIIVIALFGIWGISAFLETTVKYVSFEEARHSEKTVQVTGAVDFDTVEYDAEIQKLTFTIIETDVEKGRKPDRLDIIYSGVIPGNFDQATSVMVRGKRSANGFFAEKLFVKCPSKYQGMTADNG